MNHRIAWIAALALAAFGSAAEAQTITAVYTTYSSTGVPTKLDITGTAFCTASTCKTKPPVVRLGGNTVAISGASPTGIGIPLTGVFADGDYMLSVTPPGKSAINYAFTLKGNTGGGATGPQGPVGPQGPKGDTGSPGLPGLPGQQGLAGPKGDTGAAGANGSAGAPGAKGDKGDKGDQGDGLTFLGAWNVSTGYKANDVVTAGGSTYLALNTNTAVDPLTDTGAAWALLAAKGADGAKGDTGPAGEAGEMGLAGLPGAPGANGLDGSPGATGLQGPKGDKGDTGAQGPVGATGPQGPMGLQGPKGDVGDSGPAGPVGPQGEVGPQGVAGVSGQRVSIVDAAGTEIAHSVGWIQSSGSLNISPSRSLFGYWKDKEGTVFTPIFYEGIDNLQYINPLINAGAYFIDPSCTGTLLIYAAPGNYELQSQIFGNPSSQKWLLMMGDTFIVIRKIPNNSISIGAYFYLKNWITNTCAPIATGAGVTVNGAGYPIPYNAWEIVQSFTVTRPVRLSIN